MVKNRVCPSLTADCIVLSDENTVLLIRRGKSPFKDSWALPGGFVEVGEKTTEACVRELKEETSLDVNVNDLSLVGIYDNPDRDPRGHICSVVYMSDKYSSETAVAGDDAAQVQWHRLDEIPKMAFDHKEILSDAMKLYSVQLSSFQTTDN